MKQLEDKLPVEYGIHQVNPDACTIFSKDRRKVATLDVQGKKITLTFSVVRFGCFTYTVSYILVALLLWFNMPIYRFWTIVIAWVGLIFFWRLINVPFRAQFAADVLRLIEQIQSEVRTDRYQTKCLDQTDSVPDWLRPACLTIYETGETSYGQKEHEISFETNGSSSVLFPSVYTGTLSAPWEDFHMDELAVATVSLYLDGDSLIAVLEMNESGFTSSGNSSGFERNKADFVKSNDHGLTWKKCGFDELPASKPLLSIGV